MKRRDGGGVDENTWAMGRGEELIGGDGHGGAAGEVHMGATCMGIL